MKCFKRRHTGVFDHHRLTVYKAGQFSFVLIVFGKKNYLANGYESDYVESPAFPFTRLLSRQKRGGMLFGPQEFKLAWLIYSLVT